ncbi:MAG: hypothetical protein CVU97_07170 [Firmicutes bacterium HGW-Firmicutes-21]|nr:MAG: hypothetical protein CVU97_07170 [Firmicutes bacterium HGW-Firmicutes-21]
MGKHKICFVLLSVFIAAVMVGCTTVDGEKNTSSATEMTTTSTTAEEDLLNDRIKPVIRINATELNVRINQGEAYDLLKGITGLDNLEGILPSEFK